MNKTKETVRAAACLLLGAATASMTSAQDSSVVNHMHDHFDAVVKVQSAVIAGSLDGTREPAGWLAEHEAPAGMPAGWQEHVEAMRAAARDTLAAQDLSAAASATSRLGLACGSCHVANNVTVEFDDVKRPSDKEKSRPHMQRHQWAADRMWEGLVGPANMSWRRGADLLFESPMSPDALGAESGDDATLGMARRIHQLAANATTVNDPAERAAIYAEFLANCAACHDALDQGPGR